MIRSDNGSQQFYNYKDQQSSHIGNCTPMENDSPLKQGSRNTTIAVNMEQLRYQ